MGILWKRSKQGCFNGAVLSRGRRPPAVIAAAVRIVAASMEPSSAEDGDGRDRPPRRGRSAGFNGAVLSRGRRRIGARSMLPRLRGGFNGAVLSEGRRQRRRLSCRGDLMASMEPSSAEDGDLPPRSQSPQQDVASMEPSSAEDGDLSSHLPAVARTAWLQWSRPQSVSDSPWRVARFNGAVLSRGRRLAARVSPSFGRRCFNGAVLSRGRRPGMQGGLCHAPQASMEPSSAEDGDSAITTEAGSIRALQWSRPQQRTETGHDVEIPQALLELQWSRPQQRTETSPRLA